MSSRVSLFRASPTFHFLAKYAPQAHAAVADMPPSSRGGPRVERATSAENCPPPPPFEFCIFPLSRPVLSPVAVSSRQKRRHDYRHQLRDSGILKNQAVSGAQERRLPPEQDTSTCRRNCKLGWILLDGVRCSRPGNILLLLTRLFLCFYPCGKTSLIAAEKPISKRTSFLIAKPGTITPLQRARTTLFSAGGIQG